MGSGQAWPPEQLPTLETLFEKGAQPSGARKLQPSWSYETTHKLHTQWHKYGSIYGEAIVNAGIRRHWMKTRGEQFVCSSRRTCQRQPRSDWRKSMGRPPPIHGAACPRRCNRFNRVDNTAISPTIVAARTDFCTGEGMGMKDQARRRVNVPCAPLDKQINWLDDNRFVCSCCFRRTSKHNHRKWLQQRKY